MKRSQSPLEASRAWLQGQESTELVMAVYSKRGRRWENGRTSIVVDFEHAGKEREDAGSLRLSLPRFYYLRTTGGSPVFVSHSSLITQGGSKCFEGHLCSKRVLTPFGLLCASSEERTVSAISAHHDGGNGGGNTLDERSPSKVKSRAYLEGRSTQPLWRQAASPPLRTQTCQP